MSIGGFPQDRRGKNAGKCKCVPWFLFVSLAEQCLQPRHSSGRAGNSSVPHPRHWSPCQTLEDTVIARTDHKVKAGTHRRGSRDHQTITALQARPPIQRRTADDSDEITKDETRDEMMTSSFWGSVDKPTAGSSKRHPRVGPKPLPVDVAHALLMQPLLFTQTRNPMQHRPCPATPKPCVRHAFVAIPAPQIRACLTTIDGQIGERFPYPPKGKHLALLALLSSLAACRLPGSLTPSSPPSRHRGNSEGSGQLRLSVACPPLSIPLTLPSWCLFRCRVCVPLRASMTDLPTCRPRLIAVPLPLVHLSASGSACVS